MLPDPSRLVDLPPEAWGAFGRRLTAVGYTAATFAPYAKLASLAPDPRRACMAKWHLRRVPQPSAYAARMFGFADAVSPAEAQAVLGDELPLERMLAIGLLTRSERGVVSPFVLQPYGDLHVLGDDLSAGGDAVMGAAPSSKSIAAMARPRERTGRALDLGCGAGTIALSLSQRCDRVVATDVSERAIALSRVNAALNGASNVECRLGDLYEPVAGESFDVIASQPPFVARPEDAPRATFLFGGARGDELATRVLRGLVEHLAPGGMAFLLAEWPIVEGDEPLDERIEGALASTHVSALQLLGEDASIDDHCARYASIAHPTLDEVYEREAMRRRDHFERMRIQALRPAVLVVRRGEPGLVWRSVVQMRGGVVSRARIDAMFGARDLLAAGEVEGEVTSELLTSLEERLLAEQQPTTARG